MPRTVHKQTLGLGSDTLQMPVAARILSVQCQNDRICLWYEFDIEAKDDLVPRHFVIAGTGHTLPDTHTLVYLGTVQQANGMLVWHVYEAMK
jgi:hypothetical protein